MKPAKPKISAPALPHSWSLRDWPEGVYPGAARARYAVRAHRAELLACGALTRIGREIVVLGAGYSAWLAQQAGRVEGFEIAPNREERSAA